jgi:hypothetical protein
VPLPPGVDLCARQRTGALGPAAHKADSRCVVVSAEGPPFDERLHLFTERVVVFKAIVYCSNLHRAQFPGEKRSYQSDVSVDVAPIVCGFGE